MNPADDAAAEGHDTPIKTPRQLIWVVALSFVVPVLIIIALVNFVAAGKRPGAGSDAQAEAAIAQRIAPVARVVLKDPASAVLKGGEEVYKAQCTACHSIGAAGAPKTGDAAAWAPRLKTGYEALLNSALKGKGVMGAQGGGDYSDIEIGRAVVYMANLAGAKFEEPKAPAAAASAAKP
jgi:cytochrome c5